MILIIQIGLGVFLGAAMIIGSFVGAEEAYKYRVAIKGRRDLQDLASQITDEIKRNEIYFHLKKVDAKNKKQVNKYKSRIAEIIAKQATRG